MQDTLIEIRKQADLMREQADISRRTLVVQFRPRVGVRLVRIVEKEGFSLELTLINKGDSPARIEKNRVWVDWTKLETCDFNTVESTSPWHGTVDPGQEQPAVLNIEPIRVPFEATRQLFKESAKAPEFQLRCWGVIYYADDNDARRSTGFDRNYDFRGGRFVAGEDPEMEYAD